MEELRVAGGEGRLTAEELDSRLASALGARTLGELTVLTADLPEQAARAAKDVLVVQHEGGKYVQEGRWVVPKRIDLRTKLCRVTLDLTDAVITSSTLRIDMDMRHGKLVIVTKPDIVIDADELKLVYSKLKLRTDNITANPGLRVEITGTLRHGKVVERSP